MACIAAGCDQGDAHTLLAEPSGGMLGESSANPAPLSCWVDRDHRDLAQLALVIDQRCRRESDNFAICLCDPGATRCVRQGFAHFARLVHAPIITMQQRRQLPTQDIAHGIEDWRPCAQRKVDDGVMVSRATLANPDRFTVRVRGHVRTLAHLLAYATAPDSAAIAQP